MTNETNNLPDMARPGIDIKKIYEDIKGPTPQISEELFVSRILPLFTTTDSEEIDLGLWMEYAGTMTTSLEVVGADGEVLFEAPSPWRSVIRLRKRDEDDPTMVDIVTTTKQKSDVMPALGENYLQTQLARLDIFMPTTDEHHQKWVEIFKRYGVIPSDPSVKSETVVKPKGNESIFSDEDDDF